MSWCTIESDPGESSYSTGLNIRVYQWQQEFREPWYRGLGFGVANCAIDIGCGRTIGVIGSSNEAVWTRFVFPFLTMK